MKQSCCKPERHICIVKGSKLQGQTAELHFIHQFHTLRTLRSHFLSCPILLKFSHFKFRGYVSFSEMIPYPSYQFKEDQLIIMSSSSTGPLSMQPSGVGKRYRKRVNPSSISVQSLILQLHHIIICKKIKIFFDLHARSSKVLF